MPFSLMDVVIFGKTYPEPSTRYYETVCTGGLRFDTGSPVRLYPVPLRYLDDEDQYRLWERVRVPVDRNARDTRPESLKIDPTKIERLGRLGTSDGWRERRELLERDPSWHYENMDSLTAANRERKTSIGLVTPGAVERVLLIPKPLGAREDFERKCAELKARKESDLFDPDYRRLEFLPNEIVVEWRCAVACEVCKRNLHRMKVLDWGLLELARKRGWEVAIAKMREIADLKTHDFRFFLGNFAQHPQNFGIIALWYPKLSAQLGLL